MGIRERNAARAAQSAAAKAQKVADAKHERAEQTHDSRDYRASADAFRVAAHAHREAAAARQGDELDVDDVTGCPRASSCASCGDATRLVVRTLTTPVGIACATLCRPCAIGRLPRFVSWAAACEAVGEHCEHLGCDVDEMATALGERP